MRPDIRFIRPAIGDATSMWHVARAAGLDENSPYKYLVFARDFASTSLIARDASGTIGFVTGYLRPTAPDTLFIWQIGVLESARGRGVAGGMLAHLFQTTAACYLEATVTPDNGPSNALFARFADRIQAPWKRQMLFPSEVFPGQHDPEVLIRIGPSTGAVAQRPGVQT
jgi:L-2,4-diaminobutyric acid acetyltransferase